MVADGGLVGADQRGVGDLDVLLSRSRAARMPALPKRASPAFERTLRPREKERPVRPIGVSSAVLAKRPK